MYTQFTGKLRIALVLFCVSLTAVMAQEDFTHAPTGMTFTLPAGWTYVHEGDHFEASSPDEAVTLLFFAGRSTDAAEALEEAGEALDSVFTDAAISTDPTEEEINGLIQVYVEGDGYVDGVRIDWDMTLVLSRRNSLAIIALGDIDGMQGVIDEIYTSIHQE